MFFIPNEKKCLFFYINVNFLIKVIHLCEFLIQKTIIKAIKGIFIWKKYIKINKIFYYKKIKSPNLLKKNLIKNVKVK
jgi:hypothetical protein